MEFTISFLDHVAIRVKDLKASANWYQKVLGLKEYKVKEWGDFPIFMLAGKTGIALFPADTTHPVIDPGSKNIRIDHFAFNVTQDHFAKAREKYDTMGIHYTFQDHLFFHSLYTRDPDGHTVELTTLVVPESEFYEQ
jgi:catechol 2,3-dioxygenase-like lactoylglutathione lyase family enzyme